MGGNAKIVVEPIKHEVDIAPYVKEVIETLCKHHEIDASQVDKAEVISFCKMDVEWFINDGAMSSMADFWNAVDSYGIELVKGE